MILTTEFNNSELVFDCVVVGALSLISIFVMVMIIIFNTKRGDLRTMTLRYWLIGAIVFITVFGSAAIIAIASHIT